MIEAWHALARWKNAQKGKLSKQHSWPCWVAQRATVPLNTRQQALPLAQSRGRRAGQGRPAGSHISLHRPAACAPPPAMG
jgi:hypothetical protein